MDWGHQVGSISLSPLQIIFKSVETVTLVLSGKVGRLYMQLISLDLVHDNKITVKESFFFLVCT